MVRRAASPGNPTNDENSRSGIPRSIKMWVIAPIIGFTVFGAVCLSIILALLATSTITSELAWPALIIAFAGLPSAYVANTKRLVDAAKSATP